MPTVIDWEGKAEPWRSIGLRFTDDLKLIFGKKDYRADPLFPAHIPPGERVKTLRTARGLSQKRLAQHAMMSAYTIDAVENDRKPTSRRTKALLSAAFRVDVRDIWPSGDD